MNKKDFMTAIKPRIDNGEFETVKNYMITLGVHIKGFDVEKELYKLEELKQGNNKPKKKELEDKDDNKNIKPEKEE